MNRLRRFPPFAVLLAVLLFSVSESRAAGLLVPRDGSPPIAVQSHRVSAELSDGLARTTLRQTFVNPHPRPLEAVYVFPLPKGAALVDVAMEVDGKRLEGLLVERKAARRIYNDIVRRQKDPALVEQIGRETFRLSVFPVVPKKETVVELTWIELVPLSQGVFRYVYPLSLGSGDATTEQDFTFSLTIQSSVDLETVTSPVEDLHILRRGAGSGAWVASLERMKSPLTTDIVVEAQVAVMKPTLSGTTYRETEGDGWFLAIVTPPRAKEKDLVPRDVILVVDTSGSMGGRKIEQARAASDHLLAGLRPADRVNVISFSSVPIPFREGPIPATKENIAEARGFVGALTAGGGTALGDALKTALDVPAAEGRVRTVVLLTDGLPTIGEKDPAKIVRLAAEGWQRGLRIFTFGVGQDVDPALLEGISSASQARAEIFKPEDQIESRVRGFLDRTASPVIANISLDVCDLRTYDLFPRPIPDAYLGEQVVLAGRYRGGGRREVTAAAVVGGKNAKISSTVDFRETPGGSPAVAALFAHQKLTFLEGANRLREGLADDAYYAALDRGAYSTQDEIREEMIAVSLDHGVQCAYTSFLVLLPEDRRRIDPRNAEAVAQAIDRARKLRGDAAPDLPADAPSALSRTKTSTHFFGKGSSSGRANRGPAGEVPPGQRDPRDPQPPAERPGTPTPGPAGPAGPPPGGATASPAGRPAAPRPMTFDHWLFWWAHNKDEIFYQKTAGRPALPVETVQKEIVPALLAVIGNTGLHAHIRAEAMLALGRSSVCADHIPLFIEYAKKGNTGAILSLGLLPAGSPPEVDATLVSVLDDAGATTRARCFAALALGFSKDSSPEARRCLIRRLTEPAPREDLRILSILGLGLIGDTNAAADMTAWLKAGKIGAHKLTSTERAHLIGALGWIGDPASYETVAALLRKKNRLARRSVAMALGRIIPRMDGTRQMQAVRELVTILDRYEKDLTTRSLILISLGRIGADPSSPREVREFCRKVLAGRLAQPGAVERAYAVLALGLLARGEEGSSERLPAAAWKGGAENQGAAALSLGLSGDSSEEMVARLIRTLKDRGEDKKVRGAAAVSLGLLDGEKAAGAVLDALVDREDRDLRMDAANAAGLLGDERAVPLLLAIFEDPKSSQFALGSAAWALGRIGGATAVAELVRVLEPSRVDGSYPDLSRAMAANALGQIAMREEARVLHRLTRDLNYRASVPGLDAVLGVR